MENTSSHRNRDRIFPSRDGVDKTAFRHFFNEYYPKLIHFASIFLPSIQASEEVVSDVFYKIIKNPGLLNDINDLGHYMFFAVRNQAFTWIKNNKKSQSFEPIEHREDYLVPDREDPEKVFIDKELYDLLRKAIDLLPPKRRTVFMLVKEEGMKYKAVAELLGISVKTVEMQMSQALATVRLEISHYLESHDMKIKRLPRTGFLTILL